MKKFQILISIFLFCIPYSFSQEQESTCKVLLEEISGSYKGDCKDGLAHGKGTAIGEDFYVGMFKNGLPDGKGKYTYKNGNAYSGKWSNGLKNGKGKFKYSVNGKATVLNGYWKDGEYTGNSNPDELYRITNLSGIEYYSIKKMEGNENQIEISFERVFLKYIPKDLQLTTSTGYINQMNKKIIINDYACPLICTIHFTIKIADDYRQCNFSFDVLKPGKYEVFISNN